MKHKIDGKDAPNAEGHVSQHGWFGAHSYHILQFLNRNISIRNAFLSISKSNK